jgi:hypothetical protein
VSRSSPPPPPRHGYEDREDSRRRAAIATVQPREREREAPARRAGGLRVTELDVPEYMPHR